MKVINLVGGPGTGKSTSAAELFALMKWNNMNVELVSEHAKQVTWEGHTNILNDQLYLLAKQNRKLERLRGKVDYVITDSPLFLGTHYAPATYLPNTFVDLVFELWDTYDNINFCLKRKKPYHQIGRSQDEQQAREIDVALEVLMHNNDIPYYTVDGVQGNSEVILQQILQEKSIDY